MITLMYYAFFAYHASRWLSFGPEKSWLHKCVFWTQCDKIKYNAGVEYGLVALSDVVQVIGRPLELFNFTV